MRVGRMPLVTLAVVTTQGEYLKYFERNRRKDEPGHEAEPDRILCRIEKFVEYNARIDSVLRGDKVLRMTGQLFGEQARACVLYARVHVAALADRPRLSRR